MINNLATNVKWNLTVYVEDGPTLTSSGRLYPEGGKESVNSVVTINVTVLTKESTRVSVQPGPLEDFEFIFIKSNQYGDVGTNLSYKFGEAADGTADSHSVILEKDHILTSGQLINLFKKAPNYIVFTNDTDFNADINIVVAKNAVVV